MNYIHNKNGDIIQRSKNLAGIRRYASKHPIKSVHLTGFVDGTGVLSVLFIDEATSMVHFASFEVLQMFVRNWRNARGVSMVVNGLNRGVVTSKEPCNYPAPERKV